MFILLYIEHDYIFDWLVRQTNTFTNELWWTLGMAKIWKPHVIIMLAKVDAIYNIISRIIQMCS